MIDVREKDERDEGYIPGSRNVPYRLMRLCCPDLPDDRPVVTICGSGPRAAIAASILRGKGDRRPAGRRRRHGRLARPRPDRGHVQALRLAEERSTPSSSRRRGGSRRAPRRQLAALGGSDVAQRPARVGRRACGSRCGRERARDLASSCGAPISRSVSAASSKRPASTAQRGCRGSASPDARRASPALRDARSARARAPRAGHPVARRDAAADSEHPSGSSAIAARLNGDGTGRIMSR